MFEPLQAADHVIALALSGKITGDDIQAYKRLLDEKLKAHEHLGACVDMTGLADMNADALVEGMKADLKLMGHLNQFSRYALVTDKEWPEAIMRFLDPLFPMLELKVFAPDARAEALAWAGDFKTSDTTRPPAISWIETNREDVRAFQIDGMLTKEEMPTVMADLKAFLDAHEKVRLLVRIKRFAGFDPAVLMQEDVAAVKLNAMNKVERYAIVGAPGWMSSMVGGMNPMFKSMDMMSFPADQEAEAWSWISAEPR